MEINILGCGTSTGVPMIGCNCEVCISSDIRNQRSRSSILIKEDGYHILIDAAVELRLQLIRERIHRIDALLLTHTHADHLHGLDDLRPFCRENPLPFYATKEDLNEVKQRFPYIFQETQKGGGKPKLDLKPLDRSPVQIGPLRIQPIPVLHGSLEIRGYRLKNFAYITDCSAVPEESMKWLEGLDLLILGALRIRPHQTHFSIPEALDFIKKIRPRRALLTHLNHDVDYEEQNRNLPDHVSLCYDGLHCTL